jgi:hypothetical protein
MACTAVETDHQVKENPFASYTISGPDRTATLLEHVERDMA